MRMNKIVILVCVLMISFCLMNSAAHAQKNTTDIKKLTLALNWKAEPQFGGFYAGIKKDHFKKNGFEIDVLQGGSGTPTLQMLISKKVDIAIVSADELLLAYAQNQKNIQAIFAVFQKNPQGILLRENINAKNLQDLLKNPKLTLLWQSGLPYALFLKKKFDFKINTAPYSGGLTSFYNDDKIIQQCFVTSEPILAQKQGLKTKTFLIADSGYNPYTTVVVVRKDFWQNQGNDLAKLQRALKASWADYLDNPDPINEYMHKLNPAMDSEIFKRSAEAQKDLILPVKDLKDLGQMTVQRWSDLAEQLVEIGLIKKAIPNSDLNEGSIFIKIPVN